MNKENRQDVLPRPDPRRPLSEHVPGRQPNLKKLQLLRKENQERMAKLGIATRQSTKLLGPYEQPKREGHYQEGPRIEYAVSNAPSYLKGRDQKEPTSRADQPNQGMNLPSRYSDSPISNLAFVEPDKKAMGRSYQYRRYQANRTDRSDSNLINTTHMQSTESLQRYDSQAVFYQRPPRPSVSQVQKSIINQSVTASQIEQSVQEKQQAFKKKAVAREGYRDKSQAPQTRHNTGIREGFKQHTHYDKQRQTFLKHYEAKPRQTFKQLEDRPRESYKEVSYHQTKPRQSFKEALRPQPKHRETSIIEAKTWQASNQPAYQEARQSVPRQSLRSQAGPQFRHTLTREKSMTSLAGQNSFITSIQAINQKIKLMIGKGETQQRSYEQRAYQRKSLNRAYEGRNEVGHQRLSYDRSKPQIREQHRELNLDRYADKGKNTFKKEEAKPVSMKVEQILKNRPEAITEENSGEQASLNQQKGRNKGVVQDQSYISIDREKVDKINEWRRLYGGWAAKQDQQQSICIDEAKPIRPCSSYSNLRKGEQCKRSTQGTFRQETESKGNAGVRRTRPESIQHKIVQVQSRSVCGDIEHIIQAFKRQIELDSELRDAKRNMQVKVTSGKHDKQLAGLLQKAGFRVKEAEVKKMLVPFAEEYNPFNQTSKVASLQCLVDCYAKAETHYSQEIRQKFSRGTVKELLEKAGLNNLTRPISVEDIVRLVNMELGSFYRNRDLVLLFRRLLCGQPALERQALERTLVKQC